MANGSTDNNTVNPVGTIPQYLDYNTLRSDSIEYLGNLTGSIWTDYNEHDPGITMLEMFCYAVLDIHYRTQFPVKDILSRNPADTSPDNNFFTPAQILGCNPLTITDYRRLLIDIEGVKNAWLDVDKSHDPKNLCSNANQKGGEAQKKIADDCVDFVNGLYHVCIELDDGYETKQVQVVDAVKQALLRYRNLCEDFLDIFVLCKFDIGVCADIELELSADPETVYENMVFALQNFFSPSPKFYKLQDLLAKPKCKHIEDIFAGRPYDIMQSHGFVDVDEFEQIKLRKEIHLSDVYNVIRVDGVKTVKQLSLQKCENGKMIPLSGWRIQLPENYAPVFSTGCSGFRFTQNNKILEVDFKKFEQAFKLDFATNTKVLYQQPSPYLDAAIPKGVYRSDLGDYYSMQNEFPRVYGIAQGGLLSNATPQRRAQALQLKGYLLFFDQLLADYLMQLKNIRQLFSFSAPADTSESHTYFLNQLNSVPDLNKLLRFSIDDKGQSVFGENGSILGAPVTPKNAKDFPSINTKDPSIIIDPANQLQDYVFSSPGERDIAIQQLMNDISNGNLQSTIFSTKDGCYFFYIACTDFAITGKTFYKTAKEANQALNNALYLASFKENYRSFPVSDNNFSFDIEFNAAGYTNYLQLLLENKSLYRERREGFLNHLLSRFAEKFTDYALLSYSFLKPDQLADATIKNKVLFLSDYPDLSSNRGKACDYRVNGWDNYNISGFEKRFKALAGVENRKRHSLCNFEVLHCDQLYSIQLNFAGFNFFKSGNAYDDKEEALQAAYSFFKELSEYGNYEVQAVNIESRYAIQVRYGKNSFAEYIRNFSSASEALEVSRNLYRLFSGKVLKEDIIASKIIYRQELMNYAGKIVRQSKDIFETAADAFKSFPKSFRQINDAGKWEFPSGREYTMGKLHAGKKDDLFIDLSAFKIDINNTMIGRPDVFTYDVLDINNNFKFTSAKEFKTEAGAKADSHHLLILMGDINNYSIVKDRKNEMWKIYIIHSESIEAECASSFNSEMAAINFSGEICEIVQKHQYILFIREFVHRWRFNYPLGYEKNDILYFRSIDEYHTYDEAYRQANLFFHSINEIQVEVEQGKLSLKNNKDNTMPACSLINETVDPEKEEILKKKATGFLTLIKKIRQQSEDPKPADFKDCIAIDEASKDGEYIYRLVDKDNLIAKSKHAASTEQEVKMLRNNLFANIEKGYEFLEICLGGDVVAKRIDKNNVWYHYVIRCRKNILSLEADSILFKSYTGYPSREDAENAFNQNYLLILNKASDQNNYGSGKFISIEEIFSEQSDSCIKSDTVVVLPKETYQLLGAHDDQVARELVKLAKSYPVRIITKKSTVAATKQTAKNNCQKQTEEFLYDFVLFNIHEDRLDWQSTHMYDTAEEARQLFYFFLLFLNYKGNYLIDYDHTQCQFVVYIREVLAESNKRFKDEQDAWGQQGVEQFICVSQSSNSFHSFVNKQNCCDTFYVACGNSSLIHPCNYESAEKRNQALEQLFTTGSVFIHKNPPEIFFPHHSNIIYDLEGNALAEFLKQDTEKNFTTYCNRLMELIDSILNDANYKEDADGIYLAAKPNRPNEKIAKPVDKNICLKEWKEKLFELAYYFPIVKNTDANGKETFCVEIRFPCFNHPGNDFPGEEPCGCNGKTIETVNECYVAWKSNCCFDTCRDAFEFYYKALPFLADRNNYRPVYDCLCGPFRIELNTEQEIIAYNPQCYSTPAMNCEAIERSKKLINDEGLHLVEHILLRPHCTKDCDCFFYQEHCDNKTHCHFTWQIPGEQDPCNPQPNICFVPGADPYSFIATVALPSWPARFRKKENRQLVEDMLHREAPAHVLLRILWLAPHDLCCFETHFKKWNKWLSQKDICDEKNPTCEFLHFLFERNFECLVDCTDCPPCKAAAPPVNPCFKETDMPLEDDDDYKILNQVNELFCWKPFDCKKYKYIGCGNEKIVKPIEPGGVSTKEKPATIAQKPIAQEENPAPAKKEEITEQQKSKRQFINSRATVYKNHIVKIAADSPENEAAARALSFLSNNSPSAAAYAGLITLILENKTDTVTKIKGLSTNQKKELINHLTRHYLDKLIFVEKDIEKLKELKNLFNLLRRKKIDTRVIYKDWQAAEVKKYEPGLDIKLIESFM